MSKPPLIRDTDFGRHLRIRAARWRSIRRCRLRRPMAPRGVGL